MAQALVEAYEKLKSQVQQVIVGQDAVLEQLMIAMLARGHCLLEGVPGLAKTLMVRSLAQAINLSFKRIQFTPDLMPADITGTDIIQEDKTTGHRELVFEKGPIFSQIVLADEINRTPPKTQAALLEAMQEHDVSVGGKTYHLDEPFFVLATQNPIEQEGTYHLPEAQRDRFLFQVIVDYPTREEERQIVERTTSTFESKLEPVSNVRKPLSGFPSPSMFMILFWIWSGWPAPRRNPPPSGSRTSSNGDPARVPASSSSWGLRCGLCFVAVTM